MNSKIHLVKARVIRAGQFSWPLAPFTVWRHRLVFWRLLTREFQVRYRQTTLGIFWLILQPMLAMGIFTIVLGRITPLTPNHLPYSVFSLSGLVFWIYFSNSFLHGSVAFYENRHLVRQIYFPRALLPFSIAISKLPDLFVSLVFLALWIIVFHPIPFRTGWLLVPVHIFMIVWLVTGVLLFFSALCVRYRDVRFIVPFLVQIWFFVTPIVYPIDLVGEGSRWLFFLNPLVVYVEELRASLFAEPMTMKGEYLFGTMITAAIFLFGSLYFRRVEKSFVDVI